MDLDTFLRTIYIYIYAYVYFEFLRAHVAYIGPGRTNEGDFSPQSDFYVLYSLSLY